MSKGLRVMDAVEADVGREAASGARSGGEAQYLGEPGVVVDLRGSLGPKIHEQRWRYAEDEEGSGADGIS